MNSEELKSIIENARINKGISQRELAKLSGISRSTLNDLINGKIKKIDVDALKKLAETLDLSLEKLLKIAGYDEFLRYFRNDKDKTKSTRDLKDLINEYKKSEMSLLDFDSKKRKNTANARKTLFITIEHLKTMKNNNNSLYTIDRAIEDIQSAFNDLEIVEEKYDYNKLPKND